MLKKFITPIATLAILASSHAMAANLRYDKQLVQDAVSLAQQAKFRMPGTMLLRQSQQKLEFARQDITDLRPSPIKRQLATVLDDAIDALDARYANKFRQIQIVESSGTQALRLINRLMDNKADVREDLKEVIQMVNNAQEAVQDDNMMRAVRLLQNAIDELNDYQGDRQLNNAIREARQIIQTLTDRRAPHREKMRAMMQGRQTIIDLIRTSRTFEEGGRGGRIELGQTRAFATRYFSTEVVMVGVRSGDYDTLLLTAEDADIRIQDVEIEFGNGGVQRVRGGFVGENQTLSIDLRGFQERHIRRVKITASSMESRNGGRGGPGGPGHGGPGRGGRDDRRDDRRNEGGYFVLSGK